MRELLQKREQSSLARYLLAAVGNTPLVELDFFQEIPDGVRLFAKLESCNPGGSLKDRSVVGMLRGAIDDGHFSDGRRLLDSSTGNAGIAYAMFGSALGIPVTLVLPGNASQERLDRIRAHGAEIILTDPDGGIEEARKEAKRIAESEPERYWFCDQYSNDNNWRAHYDSTGDEIVRQVVIQADHPPAAFVAGVGTGGTITGVGRRLKEGGAGVHVAAVIPEETPGVEGLQAIGAPGITVPAILDESLIDESLQIPNDRAVAVCQRLATAGLFVGLSSGAYVAAALDLAVTGKYPTVVTILCDTGERYGSTDLWHAPPAAEPSPLRPGSDGEPAQSNP